MSRSSRGSADRASGLASGGAVASDLLRAICSADVHIGSSSFLVGFRGARCGPVVVPASTGRAQGEDWAEKIVSELGGLLGVPCAPVELAIRAGVPGSISRNVVPPEWDRVLGSELLAATEASYRGPFLDPDGRERRPRGRPGHSSSAIAAVLAQCDAPLGSELPTGLAAFAGFVVLDAWVANQDRHDQNWAILRPAVGSGRNVLAPSYDHASSIGFNLTDDKRRTELARAGGVSHFASRARADRFEHDPATPKSLRATLVDLAREPGEVARCPLTSR